MENNIKKVLSDLSEEEKIEKDLISLYSTLLDLGVEGCLEEGEKEKFRGQLDGLKRDSERHKEIVLDLINKYK